jgi:hypothetical protein
LPRARIINDDLTDEARTEAEELAQLNEDEGGEIYRAIDEMRGTAGTTVVVVKLTPVEEKGYCENIPVAEFSHDVLKSRYGAGSYRIRMRGPKGWIPGGGTVFISSSGKKPNLTGGAGGDFMSYLEFMEKQNAERREKSNRLLELGIPALGTIIAGFLNRPQGTDVAALVTALKPPPGPTLSDLSTAMVNMQQLTGKGSASDPIDTVLKVFEAAKDLGGDSGGKGASNWIDIVRDLIREAPTVAGPILQGIAARTGARPAVPPVSPKVSVAPAAPSSAEVPAIAPVTQDAVAVPVAANASVGGAAVAVSEDKRMFALIKPIIIEKLRKVAKWASENRNPQTYAELFLDDEIPANFGNFVPQDKAIEYLRHPDWWKYVCEWEPSLAPHYQWCDEFRLELLSLISLADEPDETPPTMQGEPPAIDSAS